MPFLYAVLLPTRSETESNYYHCVVRMLKKTLLYAVLSGLSFGDTPNVGTFYDFFSRIWQNSPNNHSPKERFLKMKPTKGKKKGDKTPCNSSSTDSKLLSLLERWQLMSENPFALIFQLY